MAPISVDVVPSLTDAVAAWATLGAALAAVLGLGATIWLAAKERRAIRAEHIRQERVPQLMTITEQYALFRASSELGRADEEAKAREALGSVLALMPEGMVRMLKKQFGIALTAPDEQRLLDRFPEGIPDPIPVDAVMAELRSNLSRAGYGALSKLKS